MKLRPATLEDAQDLAELGRSSFCTAFEHLYDPADLHAFLQQAYTVDVISNEIADPATFHFLAEEPESGKIMGFCKMKTPSSYARHSDAANPIGLGQLYTDPARTGEGIGAALMEWALDFARSRHCDAIQLSVWSENFGAQRFYSRYGFKKIADIDFWVGKQRDHEFLFELRL